MILFTYIYMYSIPINIDCITLIKNETYYTSTFIILVINLNTRTFAHALIIVRPRTPPIKSSNVTNEFVKWRS